MQTHFLNILAGVLHCANSRRPYIREREFYALKELLLKRFGAPDGFDVQYIRLECWDCDGTGKLYMDGINFGEPARIYIGPCRRCTNGAYREFWVRLERHTLGKYLFHIPKERYSHDPGLTTQRPVIEGHVKHHNYPSHLPFEAALWLFLVFEPRVFWRTFGKIGAHKARTPLCLLSNLVFWRNRICWKLRRRVEMFVAGLRSDIDDIPF